MSRSRLPAPLRGFLLFLFAFLPAIWTGHAVWAHGVDVPLWDDWERSLFLQKYFEGTLTFKDLYAPYIDHKMLFPRLIVIANTELTGGNLRAEMFLNFALYFLSVVALYLVLRKTFGGGFRTAWIMFLLNMILFCPTLYQNFLWAILISMMLPLTCLGFLIWVLQSRLRWWFKTVLAVLLCVVATHSFSHGILTWAVAVAYPVFFREKETLRPRWIAAAVIAVLGAGCIFLYFNWHFENSAVHAYGVEKGGKPPGFSMLSDAATGGDGAERAFSKFEKMFFGLSGSYLSRAFPNIDKETYSLARDFGRGLLATFLASLGLWLYVGWKNRTEWNRMLPWVALGGYSFFACFFMSIARTHASEGKALIIRYTCIPMFMLVATVVLLAWALQLWIRRAESQERPDAVNFRRTASIVLGVAFAGFLWPMWTLGAKKMEDWELSRLQAKAALMYLPHFEPEKPGILVHDIEKWREQIAWMNEQGILRPALLETPSIEPFTIDEELLAAKNADLDNAIILGGGHLYLKGYANLDLPDRIADLVLITAKPVSAREEEEPAVVGAARVRTFLTPNHGWADNVYGLSPNLSRYQDNSKWEFGMPLKDLPQEELELRVYLVDAKKMRLQQINDQIRFNPATIKAGEAIWEKDED